MKLLEILTAAMLLFSFLFEVFYDFSEELRLRCGKSSALKDLQAVAFGNFQYNTRMKKLEEAKNHGGSSKYYLQPEEQAVCLIDQATDLNLLGRTYWGWEPFL